ncbi:MAG: hypothetical protein SH850_00195 [Planctomycetaceae bacterium]|nr:hypothetical protein [Planctomycetaceae bacterium]
MNRTIVLSLLLSATTSIAAEPVPVFRWQRAVELPAITETSLVAVPLDSHVFAHTRDGWPDVRLQTAAGSTTAFVIHPAMIAKDRTVREFWAAEQTAAKLDGERGLQVELTLRDKESSPHGLRIVSPLRDFEHQVQVETSADGVTWQSAGAPTLIFDYTRFVDARNDVVPFAAGDHRRFRLTIADVTAEQESLLLELHRRLRGSEETDRTERTTIARRPFRIDRIEFYRDVSRPQSAEPRTTEHPVQNLTTTEEDGGQRTVVAFETQREPLTALTVVTDAQNFSRTVNVETEVDADRGQPVWKPFSPGTLTRFSVGDLRRDELTIKLPETRRSKFRLVIENDDSPPIAITSVTASGPVYELTFLAERDQKYELSYGSPDAEAGRYDTAALQAAIQQRHAATPATLSAPRENPNAPADRGRRWAVWNDPRVLTGVIVGLTLFLGFTLYSMRRGIKATDEPPLQPPL